MRSPARYVSDNMSFIIWISSAIFAHTTLGAVDVIIETYLDEESCEGAASPLFYETRPMPFPTKLEEQKCENDASDENSFVPPGSTQYECFEGDDGLTMLVSEFST